MPITTLQKVKSSLQISGTNKDTVITELIPLVEDWIKGYCNQTYTEGFPAGYELIAIKMIEFNLNQKSGMSAESLSRHSVTFAEDYPKSITKGLRRRLAW
jgi:Phage gp6-like head-tail connector protein